MIGLIRPVADRRPPWRRRIGSQAQPVQKGWVRSSMHASYLHRRWAAVPGIAPPFPRRLPAGTAGRTGRPMTGADVGAPPAHSPTAEMLRHHGDVELAPGLIDLAVNIRLGMPPRWLADRLAAVDPAPYPDQHAARQAVAARHRRPTDEVLLTAGSSEAFVLIARALRPRHAVVIHPQFTEPEVALAEAGHRLDRVVLSPPFTLTAAAVPDDADLVMIGNPTNPTSRLHPAQALRELCRPGRVVVVDEAFADCVPGEPESLAVPDACSGSSCCAA